MSDESRLTNVEIKLMHLEEQLEDMNEVVLQQADTITRLQRMIERVKEENSAEGVPANQKPPHY